MNYTDFPPTSRTFRHSVRANNDFFHLSKEINDERVNRKNLTRTNRITTKLQA